MKVTIDLEPEVIQWLQCKTMNVGSPLEKLANKIFEACAEKGICIYCGGTGRLDDAQCACGANPKEDDYPDLGFEVYRDVTITPSPDPLAFARHLEHKRLSEQSDE